MINIGITIAAPTTTTLKSFSNASKPIDHNEVKKWLIFHTTSIGVQPKSVMTMPTRIEKTSSFMTTRPGVSPRNELTGFDIGYPSKMINETLDRFQWFKVQSSSFWLQDYSSPPDIGNVSNAFYISAALYTKSDYRKLTIYGRYKTIVNQPWTPQGSGTGIKE